MKQEILLAVTPRCQLAIYTDLIFRRWFLSAIMSNRRVKDIAYDDDELLGDDEQYGADEGEEGA